MPKPPGGGSAPHSMQWVCSAHGMLCHRSGGSDLGLGGVMQKWGGGRGKGWLNGTLGVVQAHRASKPPHIPPGYVMSHWGDPSVGSHVADGAPCLSPSPYLTVLPPSSIWVFFLFPILTAVLFPEQPQVTQSGLPK